MSLDLTDHKAFPGAICPLETNLDLISPYINKGVVVDLLDHIEGVDSVSFFGKEFEVGATRKGVLLKATKELEDGPGDTQTQEFEFEFMGEWIKSVHTLEGEGGAEWNIYLPPTEYGVRQVTSNIRKRLPVLRSSDVQADDIVREVMRDRDFSNAVRWLGPCLGNSEALYEKKMHEVLNGISGLRMIAAMNQLIVSTEWGEVYLSMDQLGRELQAFQYLPSIGKVHQRDSWRLNVQRAERSESITRVSLERFHHLA